MRARVAVSTFLVALLTSGVLTTLFAVDAHRARLERLRAEGRRVAFSAVTLYDVLRLTGSDADKATLQAFLTAAVRGTSSEEELAYAEVVDASGAVVASAQSSRSSRSGRLADVKGGGGAGDSRETAGTTSSSAGANASAVAGGAVAGGAVAGGASAGAVAGGASAGAVGGGTSPGAAAGAAGKSAPPLQVAVPSLLPATCPGDTLCIDAAVVARDSSKKAPDADAGRVRVGLSTAPAQRALVKSVAVAGTASALIALLFSGALFVFISRRVVQPISRVLGGMNALKSGTMKGIAPQLGTDEGALLVDGFNDMVESLAKNKSVLERHVGKAVADDISSGAVQTGRRVHITALFFDVEGFAARVSRDPPESVVTFLHEVIGACVDIVEQHEGHVSRLMGDTLLAMWGVSQRGDDAEKRAVDAAVAIHARCRAISDALRAQQEEPFTVGVGVATGDAVVAIVGSAGRAESVVVGEPVSLAQRAQEEAKATNFGVLVSEDTYAKVAAHYEGAATPPMLLRGFGVPLTLYRVRARAKP